MELHGMEGMGERWRQERDSSLSAKLPTLPLSAPIGVPANGHGAWPCTVCYSGGPLGSGWLGASKHGRPWLGLGLIQIGGEEGR